MALFGQASIALLLAEREFIGADGRNHLTERDIPFTIRLRQAMPVIAALGGA